MNERIVIEYAPAEGALLRLLGLIERRGFRVCAIDMAELPGGGRAIATLEDRKSTRLNSSHVRTSRMPSSA